MRLTKAHLTKLLSADQIRLRFHVPMTASSVPAIMGLRHEAEDGTSQEDFPVDLRLRTYLRGELEPFRPFKGSVGIDPYWGTATAVNSVLRLLKVGDEIRFELGINGGSPLLDEHGLVMDSLFLRVDRNTPVGVQEFKFLLDERVSALGSPARMLTFVD